MKIKYQIILLLTAMVMLFGGCGKKNTVVTGRYYYPDQEKDAKTEETSDDADVQVIDIRTYLMWCCLFVGIFHHGIETGQL